MLEEVDRVQRRHLSSRGPAAVCHHCPQGWDGHQCWRCSCVPPASSHRPLDLLPWRPRPSMTVSNPPPFPPPGSSWQGRSKQYGGTTRMPFPDGDPTHLGILPLPLVQGPVAVDETAANGGGISKLPPADHGVSPSHPMTYQFFEAFPPFQQTDMLAADSLQQKTALENEWYQFILKRSTHAALRDNSTQLITTPETGNMLTRNLLRQEGCFLFFQNFSHF
jgi:hypothetical protein